MERATLVGIVSVIIICVVVILHAGCASTIPVVHPKEPVYLASGYGWVSSPFGKSSPFKSITLKVVNRKYMDLDVTVTCLEDYTSNPFGKNTVTVKARDSKIFTVLGMDMEHFPKQVTCKITATK